MKFGLARSFDELSGFWRCQPLEQAIPGKRVVAQDHAVVNFMRGRAAVATVCQHVVLQLSEAFTMVDVLPHVEQVKEGEGEGCVVRMCDGQFPVIYYDV